jgi:hypothetical protein
MGKTVVYQRKKQNQEEPKGDPKLIASSTVSCTKGVSQESCSAVWNQKKEEICSKKFTKGNVVIMPHQELWLPRYSGMDFTGPLLWRTLSIWSGSATDARGITNKITPQTPI